MTFTDTFETPADNGPPLESELHSSLGESLGAQLGQALSDNPSAQLYQALQRRIAGGEVSLGALAETPYVAGLPGAAPEQVPDTAIEDAKARVKDEGLEGELTLPEQPSIKSPVLDMMINDAHERRDREAAVARGPHGFFPGALGFATSIGAGVIDPINAAAFSIPVWGEARWGKLMFDAGDSLAARAGVRAVQGGVQGLVGTAALQPADWWLSTDDGRDYTMADALRSVVLGAGMGAVAHAGIGAFGDVRARMAGRPLAGGPEAAKAGEAAFNAPAPVASEATPAPAGEEVPGVAPAEENAPAASPEAPVPSEGLPPDHPASVLADLPEAARADVARAAIADLTSGRPVRAAEMLQEAAKVDPRIAESIDAWHGSPHDFAAFSTEHIGTGEGAQAYGHGLYFAEEEGTARSYQRPDAEAYYAVVGDPNEPSKFAVIAGGPSGDGEPYEVGLSRAAALALRDRLQNGDSGNLYKVRIHANREHFLDWDKPLSEQSKEIQEIAARFGVQLEEQAFNGKPGERYAPTGGALYQRLANKRAEQSTAGGGLYASNANASSALREAGIPGIKYLDQGSRLHVKPEDAVSQLPGGKWQVAPYWQERFPKLARPFASREEAIAALKAEADSGTRNYVVFNDKDVEITHKNGEPVVRNSAPMPRAVPTDAEIARDLGRVKPLKEQSLLQFLRARGGLKPDPEINAVFGRNKLDLVRNDGMSLDQAREAAVEAGYLHDESRQSGGVSQSTVNYLLDAMAEEERGNKLYPAGAAAPKGRDLELERHEADLNAGFQELGQNWRDVPKATRDRALHIMYTEGVADPLAAYERAVMEEDYYGERAGKLRRVAGNQLPAESRTAPSAGGRDQGNARAGEPGAAARPAGGDDRGAPDWRRFAAEPDDTDPQLTSASREADAAPEPASLDAGKSVSAAEQAAADADKILEDLRPMLSEEERAQIDDVLAQLDRERADRAGIIKEGAACLAAAVA